MRTVGSLTGELPERDYNAIGHLTPRASQDLTQQPDQIGMLKEEIARLSAALEQRGGSPDGEVSKLRKANRVLEAHVEMLRSNLTAARSESAETSRRASTDQEQVRSKCALGVLQ